MSLSPWDYNPATGEPGVLTVNGELHKLAHNVTFGHGLHGGIHWRTDSDASIALGEAVAISFLTDLVCTYEEPFSITITKIDGTTHTFTNTRSQTANAGGFRPPAFAATQRPTGVLTPDSPRRASSLPTHPDSS